jgi:hypothetical protein
MTIQDYLHHYFTMPDIVFFFLVSLGVVVLIHFILYAAAKHTAGLYVEEDVPYVLRDEMLGLMEKYYELVFSATSMLFFVGIYFLIDFNYFGLGWNEFEFWNKYSDYILLAMIVISVALISLMDRLIIPLRRLKKGEKASLRMAAMVYMTVIFFYIKFIYLDNNYDSIIAYFITLIIGRFVYFDATLEDFGSAMKDLAGTLPILGLVLLSTGLLALYGFRTGYLLRANGVVVSLFIAHLFMIIEIFVIARTGVVQRSLARRIRKIEAQRGQREE